MPAAAMPRLQPLRRGPTLTSVNSRGGPARAQVGRLDPRADVVVDRAAAGRRRVDARPRRQVGVKRRRHLAGDAVDGQAVGPVGRDLELHHSSAIGSTSASGVPGATPFAQQHEAVVLAGQLELALRQHHPVRLDARAAWPCEAPCRRAAAAPGSATATVSPAAKLVAPQTIWRGSPSPTSTVHSDSRSASGCRSRVSTRPTRNSSSAGRHAVAVDRLQLGAGHAHQLAQLGRAACRS